MTIISPALSSYRDLSGRADAFIAAARTTHGDRYDYRHVHFEYTNAHTKVTIVCPTHGQFSQTPNEHRRGERCPDCSARRHSGAAARATRFLDRARDVHGDQYDYSEVSFVDQKTPVRIRCRQHGSFEQRPTNHLSGRGCGVCARDARVVTLKVVAQNRPPQRRNRDGEFAA